MSDKYREETVSIHDIEDDEHFKISRNFKSPELITSLKNSGMLEIPFLIKRGNSFYPFTCHNRLAILSEAGISSSKPYAAIQQFGGQAGRNRKVTIPARPYMPITDDKELTSVAKDSIMQIAEQYFSF